MNVEDPLNWTPKERTRGIIEKSIDDLESILIVFSLVAFEKLEPEEMQAIARGGYEMTARLQSDLEGVLSFYSTIGHAEGDDAEAATGDASVADRLASSSHVSGAPKHD